MSQISAFPEIVNTDMGELVDSESDLIAATEVTRLSRDRRLFAVVLVYRRLFSLDPDTDLCHRSGSEFEGAVAAVDGFSSSAVVDVEFEGDAVTTVPTSVRDIGDFDEYRLRTLVGNFEDGIELVRRVLSDTRPASRWGRYDGIIEIERDFASSGGLTSEVTIRCWSLSDAEICLGFVGHRNVHRSICGDTGECAGTDSRTTPTDERTYYRHEFSTLHYHSLY